MHLVAAVANLVVQKVPIQGRGLWDRFELDRVFFWQRLLTSSSAKYERLPSELIYLAYLFDFNYVKLLGFLFQSKQERGLFSS